MIRRTGFPMAVVEMIWDRAQGLCEVSWDGCTGRGVEIQHRRARGAGGTRRLDTSKACNGILVCRECHRFIEGHPALAAENGWRVAQNEQPFDVGVLRRGDRVLLDNDGGIQWEDTERTPA